MSIVPSPWSSDNFYPRKPENPHQPYNYQAPPKTPSSVDIYTLFPNIDRITLGYDMVLDTLKRMSAQKTPSYPPYNITKNGDDYTVEMALAGFRKDEVEVLVEDRTLIVRSDIEDLNDTPEEGKSGEVIHHGIAQRNFTTKFALGEFVEVVDAQMADGILTVKLETHIPDEKKPKVIEVK
jgi:molecular chaperone IbpA